MKCIGKISKDFDLIKEKNDIVSFQLVSQLMITESFVQMYERKTSIYECYFS